MLNPFVSIIVPNYNHKPFLKQRLDSIFDQTFENYEVILLDDASTDGSQELLKKYKDHPRVTHYVENAKNSGSPFKQWRKGIELAKGEYIWIAESDDYCEPEFLEKLLKNFGESTVLAYCASIITDERGNSKGRHKWADALEKNRWRNNFSNSGLEEIEKYLKYRNCITNASAVIFKRSAISNIRIPIEMKFCGDWFLWIEILKLGSLEYVSEPLNYFRRHESSTRGLQSFTKEKQRFNEYFYIICSNSSFISRIWELNKYDWILAELYKKKNTFGTKQIFKLNMPLELMVRYFIKYKAL
jgi:glycosyltransferase involved in cell wall biosynthesis